MRDKYHDLAPSVLEDFESQIRLVSERLAKLHGTPHLGNYSHPTAEFVFIVLSRKTPQDAYRSAFQRLIEFESWETDVDDRTSAERPSARVDGDGK